MKIIILIILTIFFANDAANASNKDDFNIPVQFTEDLIQDLSPEEMNLLKLTENMQRTAEDVTSYFSTLWPNFLEETTEDAQNDFFDNVTAALNGDVYTDVQEKINSMQDKINHANNNERMQQYLNSFKKTIKNCVVQTHQLLSQKYYSGHLNGNSYEQFIDNFNPLFNLVDTINYTFVIDTQTQ